MITAVDQEPKLPFLKTRSKAPTGPTSFKVSLGIMPSYAGGVEGLKVDGVSDGRPGQKAGILAGDVIVEMGTQKILNIEDYMKALGQFDKGQTVPLKVKRASRIVSLSVTF